MGQAFGIPSLSATEVRSALSANLDFILNAEVFTELGPTLCHVLVGSRKLEVVDIDNQKSLSLWWK